MAAVSEGFVSVGVAMAVSTSLVAPTIEDWYWYRRGCLAGAGGNSNHLVAGPVHIQACPAVTIVTSHVPWGAKLHLDDLPCAH